MFPQMNKLSVAKAMTILDKNIPPPAKTLVTVNKTQVVLPGETFRSCLPNESKDGIYIMETRNKSKTKWPPPLLCEIKDNERTSSFEEKQRFCPTSSSRV